MELIRLSGRVMSGLSQIATYLLQHKNLGAVAGFAIAILCTFKIFKAPAERRQGNTASCSSTSSKATGGSIEESATTLAVKRRLRGARKVTCQLLALILEETKPEELQRHAVVRKQVVEVLLELVKCTDLYLFAEVLDDKSEENVLVALDEAGICSQGGLDRNKVLFYGTNLGSNSFVRQLEPELHIDNSTERTDQLARFVRYQLLVAPSMITATLPSNVFPAESLESYFLAQ